jgi:hypothetical protein
MLHGSAIFFKIYILYAFYDSHEQENDVTKEIRGNQISAISNPLCVFSISMFGKEAVCPDGLFVPAVFRESGFYLSSLICPVNRICPANRKCALENFCTTAAEQRKICPVLGTNADTSS